MFKFWGVVSTHTVVSGPITMKFCTDMDNQIISLNMRKNVHKSDDVIDNDIIILKLLSFVQK